MNNFVEESIKEDYLQALKGREYWIKIKREYNFSMDDCLVLFSTNNRELSSETKKWLPVFAKRKQFKKVIFVSREKLFFEQGDEQDSNSIIFEHIVAKDELECLLKYYRLTRFTKYIYDISLEPPVGNDFMIGHKGITFSDWLRNFG